MKRWEVLDMEVGHIAADFYENGVRVIIMRGPSSLCCYIGVPLTHPLAGHSYDDIPLQCHGGLTYSDKCRDGWPEGFWWYGWDYAHSGDRCVYAYRVPSIFPMRDDETEWTVAAVRAEVWSVTYDFSKLVRLAEAIATKSLGWKAVLEAQS